ncbi:MAG: hypothetical protein JWM50_492, partial [Microbacteriaceae bacterium]|nr:hypothetical protein [Microbacteriaceae bacterium]
MFASRFLRFVTASAAVVVMLGVSQTATAPAASAQVTNCTAQGPGGNYFDGEYRPSAATLRGVSAVLTAKRASVCDTDTTAFNPSTLALGNFTYSWTMIANTAGGSWLQSGYFRSYGTSMFHFAQYKPLGGGVYDVFGDVVPTGEVHHYWQQYLPDSSGAFHSNVDSTRFINATPSGWSGYSGQY